MFTFYLFAVSFVGLLFFYLSTVIAVGAVGAGLFGEWGFQSEPMGAVSIAWVTGALWFWHWRTLTRKAKMSEGDHDLIQFHLLIVSAMLVLGLGVFAVGVGNQLLSLLGLRLEEFDWSFGVAAINLAITFVLWRYHLLMFKKGSKFKLQA